MELHGDAVGVFLDSADVRQRADFRDEFGRRIRELDVNRAAQAQRAIDVLKRPARHHLPRLDDADARAELAEFMEDVAGNQDRFSHRLQFLEQLAHLDAGAGIEAARRFVEQQQLGIVQEHARQAEALLHPARERIDRRIGFLRQVGEREHVAHDGLAPRGFDGVGGGEEMQVFSRGQVVIHAEEIRHVADLPAHALRIACDVDPRDRHQAARGLEQRREDFDRRGFPRAVRPDEAEDFPARNAERKPAHGARVAVGDVEIFHGDERLGRRIGSVHGMK